MEKTVSNRLTEKMTSKVRITYTEKESFYITLRDHLQNGLLASQFISNRKLNGDWEVGVSSIELLASEKIPVKGEPIHFLVLSRTKNQWLWNIISHLLRDFSFIIGSVDDVYPNLPAGLLCHLGSETAPELSPDGDLDRDTFRKRLNATLHKPKYFETSCDIDYSSRGEPLGSIKWHMQWTLLRNLIEEVFVVPIFGPETRKLIGMPEYRSNIFQEFIGRLTEKIPRKVLLDYGCFPPFRPFRYRIAIESNVTTHNTNEIPPFHDCETELAGHRLRLIGGIEDGLSNRNIAAQYDGERIHYQPFVDRSVPFIIVRLVNTDTSHPICSDKAVTVTLHFRRISK